MKNLRYVITVLALVNAGLVAQASAAPAGSPKPIWGTDSSKPIWGTDVSKPIWGTDSSKPIWEPTNMPNTALPSPRTPAAPVVNPAQNAPKPNRALESKMDRLMFGALSASPLRFGLE